MFVVKKLNYLRCINFAVIIVIVNAFQINVRKMQECQTKSCRKNLKRLGSFKQKKLSKFIVVGHLKRLRILIPFDYHVELVQPPLSTLHNSYRNIFIFRKVLTKYRLEFESENCEKGSFPNRKDC